MRGYKRLVMHRRVLVNLTTEKAIDGILWAESKDLIVLKDAHLHERGKPEPVALDGEAIVERINIDFCQVLP